MRNYLGLFLKNLPPMVNDDCRNLLREKRFRCFLEKRQFFKKKQLFFEKLFGKECTFIPLSIGGDGKI